MGTQMKQSVGATAGIQTNAPLDGDCLAKEVFYEATVTSDLPRYEPMIYKGITERVIKAKNQRTQENI